LILSGYGKREANSILVGDNLRRKSPTFPEFFFFITYVKATGTAHRHTIVRNLLLHDGLISGSASKYSKE
jgi:hypothetical protein